MVQHNNYWFNTAPTQHSVTSGLVKNADVLIIGGGIVGISLLHQLISAGITNTYLVEESSVGFHASGRGGGHLMLRGGMLFSQMPEEDGAEYLSFIAKNNKLFLSGIRNVSFDSDLRDTGGLRIASTEEELVLLEQEADFIRKHHDMDCPMMTKAELRYLLPNIPFKGAMFVPTEATFNPYKIVNGLREVIERKGQRILTDCSVDSVEGNADDGFSVSIRHKGTIRAKQVVYCNGAYTPELLPELEEHLVRFRGQMVATEILKNSVVQILPQMSMSCNNGHEYWRLYAGRLLVGGMRHSVRGDQVGILDDGEFSPAVYERLRQFVNETLPVVGDVKFTHTWSGIMCSTSDQLPLIGSLPNRPKEFVLTGFSGYGFSHALHASIIVKDLITEGKSSRPGVRLFDPARFCNA